MIRFDNVELAFGGQVIFDRATWQATDHDRVGLVGQNGSGNTTLLKMISGEVTPDRGKVILPKNKTIGHLPQEHIWLEGNSVIQEVRSVFSEVLDLQERTRDIEEILATGEPGSTEYQKVLWEYVDSRINLLHWKGTGSRRETGSRTISTTTPA